MVLVVSVGILAAVVVPQFGGVTDDARAAATSGAVSGVRASISGYRTRAILTGQAPFPTLAQLNEQGLVVQDEFPVNPFNNLRNVQSVSSGQAAARAVVNPTAAGWKRPLRRRIKRQRCHGSSRTLRRSHEGLEEEQGHLAQWKTPPQQESGANKADHETLSRCVRSGSGGAHAPKAPSSPTTPLGSSHRIDRSAQLAKRANPPTISPSSLSAPIGPEGIDECACG